MCSSKKQKLLLAVCFLCSYMRGIWAENAENNLMCFCTAADSKYYRQVLNLIGSIQKLHFNELD